MNRKGKNSTGFTLIEMLVAVSIFVIVAFIVVTTFITLAEAYRKSQAIRLVIDNLNFAMDSVTLRLRDGNSYKCGTPVSYDLPCSAGNSMGITFKDNTGRLIVYVWQQEPDSSGIDRGYLAQCISADGTDGLCNDYNNYKRITSRDVDLTDVRFYIRSAAAQNIDYEWEPGWAIVVLGGTASFGKQTSEFSLQTTVSERP